MARRSARSRRERDGLQGTERLRQLGLAWHRARLSSVALGKYIILFASALHIGWAALLLADPEAAGSTPVSLITRLCGGPYRSAFVLVITAVVAMVFPFIRYRVSARTMGLMLIPQQFLLFVSAGAGIYAASVGHYADGVDRPWSFILSDQLPTILVALLYTAAVLEAAFDPQVPERPE
ncbi:MAG: hypothetical protein WD739_07425 [Actinomycetota bacterium]